MSGLRIVIFAKAPVPGKVKTRLIPELGAAGAAALARRMLLDTIAEARAADIGPVEICANPPPSDSAWGDLLNGVGLELSAQSEGDLGARLARAAQRTLAPGSSVLLIGTDCPSLDRHRLRELAVRLQDHDAVIQPAEDGGYVALGLNRFDASPFEGIAWSSASVAEETVRRIEALGWSLWRGEPLRDIDTFDDLTAARLVAEAPSVESQRRKRV